MALRDPDSTRNNILETAAQEMREKGYQAASLSEIIGKAGISKGALYHHFVNKKELGYAVFEEIFEQEYLDHWQEALELDDPISGISQMMAGMREMMTEEMMICGCPVNTISQEMAAEDEGFRIRTLNMHKRQQQRIQKALDKFRENGGIRGDVDTDSVALFLVTAFQGLASMMKTSRDPAMLQEITRGIENYLQVLRK